MLKKFFVTTIIFCLIHSITAAKILFVPLDSRPACKNFAVDIGKIAGLELIVPPHEMLDYFKIAGEPKLLESWLNDNAINSDAMIISVDQLLYGGLIAAREAEITDKEINNLITFLIKLKSANPKVSIYAFSILPRIQPQSTIENYHQRQALMEYSRMIGKMFAGYSIDNESFIELNNEILLDNMKKYLAHFEYNLKLNERLIDLAENGVIDKLILGCDDAEVFSMQSVEVEKLKHYIHSDKVVITYGADEIAMMITAQFASKNFNPKICIIYNNTDTSTKILPFMATSIEKVVNEKITQFNATIVNDPNEADFTLFISVDGNDSNNANLISQLINNNYKVALVDLSTHFDKNETLLPILIDNNVSVNSLIAYSGWNTASNSIGTALAQAVTFCSSTKTLQVYTDNLKFLNQRIIEDYFYLKDTIDSVNHSLKKSGSYDTSYLNLNTEYMFANFVMNCVMQKKINDYIQTNSFIKPFKIENEDYIIKNLSVETLRFPWQRTFEIDLKLNLQLQPAKSSVVDTFVNGFSKIFTECLS